MTRVNAWEKYTKKKLILNFSVNMFTINETINETEHGLMCRNEVIYGKH